MRKDDRTVCLSLEHAVMKKQKLERMKTDLLHLAGEYRVCSELMKRGVFATVTYGNRKSVDIYAISDTPLGCLSLRGQSSLLFPDGQVGLELRRGDVPQR
jgi:hypothetical protein